MKKIVCLLCLVCFLPFTFTLKAQQGYEDVVYLKSGSIIKGVLIEQIPNQSVKIQSKDGSVFVYNVAEIEKITKEQVVKNDLTVNQSIQNPVYRNPTTAFLWSFILPGAGQFYNGQYGKGLLMLGIDAAALGAVALFGTSSNYYSDYYGYEYYYSEINSFYYIGLGIVAVNTLWSMFDAARSANKLNTKNGLSLNFKLNRNTDLTLQPDFKLDGLGRGIINPTLGAKFSLSIN